MNRRIVLAALALAGLPLAAALAAALVPKDTTVRLSLGFAGDEPDADCDRVAISGNGRYVAFSSSATDLVEGDGNAARDVFVCDTKTLLVERVSVDSGGADADSFSNFPSLSASGRYVTFESSATDLVAGDGNGTDDVFVRDRDSDATSRVSVASDGTEGDDESEDPAISGNGRYVAFESDATNLVAGDVGGFGDVFLHDRKTGATTRVSVATGGIEADDDCRDPAISANGRWIAFRTQATNLAPADLNGSDDVFLHDRKTGTTIIASASPAGIPQGDCAGQVAVSATGRYVMFNSEASGLVADDTNGTDVMDTFVFDRVKGTTERVTLGPDDVQAEDPVAGGIFTYTVALSGSGRYAAFPSAATNLVEGGTTGPQHVYVRDIKKRVTLLMSLGPADVQGDGDSPEAALSKSGRTVAFNSSATNLVVGDVADLEDVFVRRW